MKNYDKKELKSRLTKQQYRVTQENGTQPPFKNLYHDCKQAGTYRCIVCDIPLFSSNQKFNSGCGWPAFFDQLKDANIRRINDYSHGMKRVEVRCGSCDSHLGHIFDDGPMDKGGLRYCINSASINLKKE